MAQGIQDRTLGEIQQAIIDGDWRSITGLVESALTAGVTAETLLDCAMTPAMDEVGERFSDGRYFLPELVLAARAMKMGLELIKPHFVVAGAGRKGTVVIGTVEGDIHDIGKNLVMAMLEGAGYKVIDLGFDVKMNAFVQAASDHQPDVVAMSGLLTTTVQNMPRVVKALEEANLRDKVLVAMGGTCVTRQFAHDAGADIWAEDASSAVKEINSALNRRQIGQHEHNPKEE
jgi:5-methyltetrahydrofolate--homocysteine methyltransferase